MHRRPSAAFANVCGPANYAEKLLTKRGNSNMTSPRGSFFKVLSIAVFVLMTFCYGYAQTSTGDDGCTNQSLQGEFGFTITGNNAAVGPFAIVGRFEADGQGNVVGVGTEAFFPVIGRQNFSATYTVNPECTGRAVLTFTDSGQVTHLDFILVDDGREVLLIVTDRGVVESGSAKKQFPRRNPPNQDQGN